MKLAQFKINEQGDMEFVRKQIVIFSETNGHGQVVMDFSPAIYKGEILKVVCYDRDLADLITLMDSLLGVSLTSVVTL